MKSTFLKEKERVRFLADIVKNPLFEEAVSHALAEMTTRVAGAPDGSFRMAGAVRFIEILQNLPEPSKEVPKRENRLDYKAS